jgi:hypothetical protein
MMVTMAEKDDKFSKAVDEQRRREVAEAVERARRGEDSGFSEVRGDLVEKDGVPDAIIEYEVGAGWVDSAEDHAGDN